MDFWGRCVSISLNGKKEENGQHDFNSKKYALVSGSARIVRLWEMPSGQPLTILEDHTGSVWSVALSMDG
jgi:WD40 repeat protein